MPTNPPQYPSLDERILGSPPGSLLVPTCAKELFVLRTIGTRWQGLVKTVMLAYNELMQHPGGFGSIDFKLYIGRRYREGNVVKTVAQEITVPQEVFEWPLQK